MALTAGQLEWVKNPYGFGSNDENHRYHILLPMKHFAEWFAAKPSRQQVEEDFVGVLDYDDAEFEFDKVDDEHIQLTHPVPSFWTCDDVDLEALEEAILKKLYLKPEWVEMTCDG